MLLRASRAPGLGLCVEDGQRCQAKVVLVLPVSEGCWWAEVLGEGLGQLWGHVHIYAKPVAMGRV